MIKLQINLVINNGEKIKVQRDNLSDIYKKKCTRLCLNEIHIPTSVSKYMGM